VSPLTLTILHTNDIHGHVLPSKGSDEPTGLVALGRAIRQERDRALAAGEAVLLLDAGDIFQGTPEGNLTRGEIVVDWMNHLRYDAMTLGNHEFDYGLKTPKELAAMATFPFLGANIQDETTGLIPEWLGVSESQPEQASLRGAVYLRTLRTESAEATVAVIGVTTSLMKDMTVKGRTDGFVFPSEVETVEKILGQLPPVDLVVLLTHCGLSKDEELAKAFQGRVNVIVGGHSHTRLDDGRREGNVLIAQAGCNSQRLGRVTVSLEPPRSSGSRAGRPVVSSKAELLLVGDDIHARFGSYLRTVEKKVGLPPGGLERAGIPVGRLEEDLDRVMEYESSSIGNLLTDLMRKDSGSDVAFQNKTGIRANMSAGAVSWRDVYQVSPFGNTVVTMLLKGSDLRALVEHMLAAPYRLLELSGADFVCDPALPEGERVFELNVGGQPLDPAKMYKVATNNFLSTGGDGHEAFTKGIHVRDTQVMLRDLVLDFFENNSPYAPVEAEQRIRVKQ
jgi:5'-nucleotidase